MTIKRTSTRITIDIPKADHRRLKTICAALGKSMREIVIESIEDTLTSIELGEDACKASSHIPNKETIKSIKNIEKRKNLTKAKNARDLFKKLGL